jgi:DNA-directed RNA polymerase specialized sigma24 family protein
MKFSEAYHLILKGQTNEGIIVLNTLLRNKLTLYITKEGKLDEDEADIIVTDAFLTLSDRIQKEKFTYQSEKQFENYIFTSCRNAMFDVLEKKKKNVLTDDNNFYDNTNNFEGDYENFNFEDEKQKYYEYILNDLGINLNDERFNDDPELTVKIIRQAFHKVKAKSAVIYTSKMVIGLKHKDIFEKLDYLYLFKSISNLRQIFRKSREDIYLEIKKLLYGQKRKPAHSQIS